MKNMQEMIIAFLEDWKAIVVITKGKREEIKSDHLVLAPILEFAPEQAAQLDGLRLFADENMQIRPQE